MKLRHKAELKALLAAPAKGIGAKKAQKDAATKLEAEQAQQLAELEQREKAEKEAEESAEADGAQQSAADGDDEEDPISSHAASPPAAAAASSASSSQGKQPSRAQQKKAKAAQKDAARMAQLRAETSGMRDVRGEENAAIASLLSKHTATAAANGSAPPRRRLRVKEMVSDGHCLYRALADQAAAHHLTRSLPLNDNVSPFMSLRQLCAHYMSTHRDDFAAFMLTDEGDMIDDAGWTAYLRALESEQAAVWGGHTEIVALSKAMRRPIVVWSAEGKMEVGEEFKQDGSEAAAAAGVVAAAPASAASSPSAASPSSPSPDAGPLHISFHRHYFGLGNHYNSVVPVAEDEEDEEGIEQQPQETVAAVTQGVAAL
jgi:OTU domain-containing protein 6